MNIERIMDEPLYPDEIQHYGVKGMKWGKRKARAVSAAKKVGKYAKDTAVDFVKRKYYENRYPIKSVKATIRDIRKHTITGAIGTPGSNKRVNADVKRQIAAIRDKKAKISKAKEIHKQSVANADKAWYREIAKVQKNNPNANDNEIVNKTLNTPSVKKTQAEAYKARMDLKKAKKSR